MAATGPESSHCELPSRAPQLSWGCIFLVAFALFVASGSGLEAYWRARGVRPNVPDSVELWSFWRGRVYGPSRKVLVFLGTSRVRSDVSLENLSRALPGIRSVQLGISGDRSPLGTLQSLALDADFRGTVVCELAAPFVARSRWDDQREYFLQLRNSGTFEYLFSAYVRDKAALLNSRVTISSLVRDFAGVYPSPRLRRFRSCFDRSLRYEDEVTGVPVPGEAERNQQKLVDARTVIESLGAVRKLVDQIRARGGSVVFVGLPASEATNESKSGFSGSVTWARVAELTGAVCISLESGDSQGRFHCRDGFHLDQQQAKRLTQCLINELYRNRVLE